MCTSPEKKRRDKRQEKLKNIIETDTKLKWEYEGHVATREKDRK